MHAVSAALVLTGRDTFSRGVSWAVAHAWIPVVAVLLLTLVTLVAARVPWPSLRRDARFPSDDTAANELALGALSIAASGGRWNDPTASHLDGSEARVLARRFQVTDADSWRQRIRAMTDGSERREDWQILLTVRATLVILLGRRPWRWEWMRGIRKAGGRPDAPTRAFVSSVLMAERRIRFVAGRGAAPRDLIVTSLDGLALSEAVLLATLGVRRGYASEQEARALIRETNLLARAAFPSWPEFGMSVAVGLAVLTADGHLDAESYARVRDTALLLRRAGTGSRPGPWTELPWAIW